MARVCDICGKGPQFGNTISHAHNVSKRRWNVNLRPVHARVGAATKHIRVCTSCLRSGKVVTGPRYTSYFTSTNRTSKIKVELGGMTVE